MKPWAMVWVVVCIGLSGCVQIQVVKAPSDAMVEGIPYSLPRKTFVLTVEYQLKECPDDKGSGALNIDRSVDLQAGIGPDPNERYYIPYKSLRNWFKATDFTLESHDNQTLKSVSATIEDKTAAVISSVVSTGITLASMAPPRSVAPRAASEIPKPAPRNVCTDLARSALKRLHKLRIEAKAAADADPNKDTGGTPQPKTRPIEEINVELARIGDLLKHKYSVTWTPTRQDLGARTIVPTEAMAQWLSTPIDPAMADYLQTVMEFVTDEAIPAADAKPPASSDGLLVRLPVNGVMRVCKSLCPTMGEDMSAILAVKEHVVPQLGPYVSMPLKNRIFESNTITLTIADTGVITKMGYKTNAVAEAAAGSIQTNLDAIQKARAEREKAKAASNLPSSVTEQNRAISECLAQQKAVRDAGGTPVGSCQ